MTSKEIIKRVIEHRDPPRIGLDFLSENPKDIVYGNIAPLKYPYDPKFAEWGYHDALLKRTDGFMGEVQMNAFGDIYGRLNQKTKGECIKGALQDGWELFDRYVFPEIEETFKADIKDGHKFIIGYLPFALFSRLRDSRRIDNALADTLLAEENVRRFLDKEVAILKKCVHQSHAAGYDAVMFWDDLGMQNAPLFSPNTFRRLFKYAYKAIADEAHSLGLKFIMHSCGQIYGFMEDLIDAGIDVFQFDQPELFGSEVLAKNFGSRVTIYSPVDIQKVMVTGDRADIEASALEMVNHFKRYCGGGLIMMDYGGWQDINVKEEWAQWARDVIIANAEI